MLQQTSVPHIFFVSSYAVQTNIVLDVKPFVPFIIIEYANSLTNMIIFKLPQAQGLKSVIG